MTLTTLIVTNALLGALLVYALLALLLSHGVHGDRRHRAVRAAEIRALRPRDRGRIAA
jgi:hypothetical protein